MDEGQGFRCAMGLNSREQLPSDEVPMHRIALLAAALFTCVPAIQAADAGDAAERGMQHYRIFCANCHGAQADGNGPTAKLLKIAPTDLTVIAKMNGGQFDAEKVFRALDRRHLVGADARMPVFSENLEIRTALDIVEFLKTIQQQ
jgi:mono/diheme cytochrome c family protein